MTAGAGSVWLADPTDQDVLRVEPRSGAIVDRIPVSGQPGSLVSGGGAIWVASTLNGTIVRIDPATETVTQTLRLGIGITSAIAFGLGRLWVVDTTDHALIALDPTTGETKRTLTLELRPTAVVVGDGAIWVADYDSGSVTEVDPASGEMLSTVRVGDGPAALLVADGALWVANSLDSTVTRINTQTVTVTATIPVGSGPAALASANGSIWVANQYGATVSRIDPSKNTVASTTRLDGQPAALAAVKGVVWVGAGPAAAAHRGGTLTLLATQPFPSTDPAFQVTSSLQFTRFTYDSLVTFDAAPGPAGLRLVPDLAVALPTPTGGGTTYTFRLRRGIRYSDGRPLRARDLRRAIERLFRVGGSPGAGYFSGIRGATACARRPARCDLSGGIRTDDATGTVVFQLSSPDPDFLFKLAVIGFSAPVPAGTPDHDVGYRAMPGTGPYRIAQANKSAVRFVRNPFFREWSHAAQPAGNPDVITWRVAGSFDAAAKAVIQERADWILGLLPPAQLARLSVQYPAQIHANSSFSVDFIPLNTHRAPFDDIRVRRALNYAIDRARITRMYGGAAVASTLCQPLAPGMPGYRRYCPYTAYPRQDGRWSAPDLLLARRLVAASGTKGDEVDVWGATDELGVPPQLPAYIASVLHSLGYRTRLRLVPSARFTRALLGRIPLAVTGDWQPDYPAPSSYLPGFFGCHGGYSNGYVCDPALDRQMRRATALQIIDPPRGNALWTQIDHELVDRAYWVPTVNLSYVELVSKRVRNYQYNPVGDFIADQAWLR